MNLNKLIKDTLKPLNVPVDFQTYAGTASLYITFFEYNQRGALYADNDEQEIDHFIQVDIWSKGDYTDIVSKVKKAMKQAGFSRTLETEIYEEDTKIYHKILRYTITEEVI